MAIQVGFVGAGGRARSHMRSLANMDGVEIAAICDVNAETAQSATEEFGGTAYTDYHEMLDKEELTAMYVVVPTFAHYDAEILAAQKGIHLFLEKPVAPTMEKAVEIMDAIKGAGVLSCAGYQIRYAGGTQQAKAFLEGRTIGMAVAHRWGGLPGTPWWRVMEQSGGQLVEQTTHQVDLLRYLVGEIDEVHAYYALRTMADVENLDIPDVYSLTFRFENGAVGSLSSCCALREGGGNSGINLILENMRVTVGGRDGMVVSPDEAADPGPVPEGRDIDEVFMEAVRTGDGSQILSDFEDGARSLDVTLAANKSAETGKPEPTYFSTQK
ncbi:MAG: Gfo/Idh/MocA family oxidoreductase [bacterium]|nr:Gfo/Idh/MocA family oxidoreductase [bacterium]